MEKHFKKLFDNARKTLKSLERFEKLKDKEFLSKVEYKREWRRKNRQVLLDRHCPERKCPICGRTKVKSRQLVILKPRHLINMSKEMKAILNNKKVVCRSCFRRHWT